MMNLAQQLSFLQQRQLIDDEIIQIVWNVYHLLQKKWQVNMNNQLVFMQFIHFAMALGRIKRISYLSPLDSDFLQEIKKSSIFPQIIYILQQILQIIPFSIPNNEQTYFIANLHSLILAQPHILQQLPEELKITN